MDLNGDGNIDILCGSYTGLSYILYGNNDGSFNKEIVLQDKSGIAINIGKYYDYTAGSWVTRESGGTFPNMSLTVAGKGEVNPKST